MLQLFYLENDDDGFGVPIPYDFKNDGGHGYFYANYFGDQEPYNYSGSNNGNELVDGILRISEIYLGERKNLASHQERTRSPVRAEYEEYEADEGNIFANENPVLLEKDEEENLPTEGAQISIFSISIMINNFNLYQILKCLLSQKIEQYLKILFEDIFEEDQKY